MMISLHEVKGAVILLTVAVMTAFLFNHFSPFGIALIGRWETREGVVTAMPKNAPFNLSIEIIDPERIRQIVKNKERVVLDARHHDFYLDGHLPGALSFPLADFEENLDQLFSTIKKETPLLVYCASFECTDSHTLAGRLLSLDYSDVKVFSGGLRQWIEMGMAIEKNEE